MDLGHWSFSDPVEFHSSLGQIGRRDGSDSLCDKNAYRDQWHSEPHRHFFDDVVIYLSGSMAKTLDLYSRYPSLFKCLCGLWIFFFRILDPFIIWISSFRLV